MSEIMLPELHYHMQYLVGLSVIEVTQPAKEVETRNGRAIAHTCRELPGSCSKAEIQHIPFSTHMSCGQSRLLTNGLNCNKQWRNTLSSV
eukprot:4066562-Amphidinium_carterae.1